MTDPSRTPPPPLSDADRRRYGRHLVLPEVGPRGQAALRASRVLVVGAGGLGAPVALYLAAAGVGRLGLVDFDVVDESNLQRQVLYATGDVGRAKVDAAAERLTALNPGVEVVKHNLRLSADNALDIVDGYDIVVDGSDNFPTRYLVNDACVLAGRPNVYGSIYRFEGQASLFAFRNGPCYRCVYPDAPPPGAVPSCAEGGVLGVLPGIVGAIQASETIKVIIGAGETLSGRLLLFDALRMQFRELRLRRDPDCPVCGSNPRITRLVDESETCETPVSEDQRPMSIPQMEPAELKRRLEAGDPLVVIDVREPHERSICDIGGTLIPMGEIPSRIKELDPASEIVVYCRTGRRSAHIVSFLQQWGFAHVWNLRGGLHAWADEVDATVPKY